MAAIGRRMDLRTSNCFCASMLLTPSVRTSRNWSRMCPISTPSIIRCIYAFGYRANVKCDAIRLIAIPLPPPAQTPTPTLPHHPPTAPANPSSDRNYTRSTEKVGRGCRIAIGSSFLKCRDLRGSVNSAFHLHYGDPVNFGSAILHLQTGPTYGDTLRNARSLSAVANSDSDNDSKYGILRRLARFWADANGVSGCRFRDRPKRAQNQTQKRAIRETTANRQ